MAEKKFLVGILEGVLAKVIVLLLTLGSFWTMIFSLMHGWTFWLYLSGTLTLLLTGTTIILFVNGYHRKRREAAYAKLFAKIEAQELQLDLVKGILSVYVKHLGNTIYNDQNMRTRSHADDLPPTLKTFMNAKWYEHKTPAQIDTFIKEFLLQIGFASIEK